MPTRASASRRQFMQGAAAASAAGLVLGRSALAFGLAKPVTSYAIELDGLVGTRLDGVELPGYTWRLHEKGPGDYHEQPIKGFNDFGVGSFKGTYAISEASDTLTWILATPRRMAQLCSGRVLLADPQLAVQRRVDWTGGFITSIKFPELSTAAPSRPLLADLEWQADTVTFSEGAGLGKQARPFPAAAKAGPLMTANFRLTGMPGAEAITSVELPTFTGIRTKERYGKGTIPDHLGVTFGELTLGFSAAGRAATFKQVQKIIKDGKLTVDEYLDLAIDLLDPGTLKPRATVQLFGCGLRSFSEGKHGADKDAAPDVTLSFTVERFDLKFM